MRVLNVNEKFGCVGVIALGRFDGLHLGHQKVLNAARKLADEIGAEVALFVLKREKRLSSVLSFDETVLKACELGVNTLIYAEESPELFSTSKDDFLHLIVNHFSPKGMVCGDDYTFGYGRGGNADCLSSFCDKNGFAFEKVGLMYIGKDKVASSSIKILLAEGNVIKADEMLGYDYFINGVVEKGRGDGHRIGFPTANIVPNKSKVPLKEGVYKTTVVIDGKTYKALTCVGRAPTFSTEEYKIENYILGFDKEIYGKQISVRFHEFLRGNIKFDDYAALEKQIEKDLEIYD